MCVCVCVCMCVCVCVCVCVCERERERERERESLNECILMSLKALGAPTKWGAINNLLLSVIILLWRHLISASAVPRVR